MIRLTRNLALAFAVAVCLGVAQDAAAKLNPRIALEISALEDRRSLGNGRLDALLADRDADTRVRAARALGRLGFEDSVPVLTQALADADASVRREAAFALGQVGAVAAQGPLVALAKSGATDQERCEAILALGKLAAEKPALASSPILPFLSDPLPAIRADAALALARTADSGSADRLRPLLTDADPTVQSNAAWASGRLGAKALAPDLRALLETTNADVLLAATRACGQAGDGDSANVRALSLLARNADWKTRVNVALALGQSKSIDALAGLAILGRDSSTHVRAAAASALKDIPFHFKKDDVLYPLRKDPAPEVRGATMQAFAVGLEKRKSADEEHWLAVGDTTSWYVVRSAYDSFADAALRCEVGIPLGWRAAVCFGMKSRLGNPTLSIAAKIDAAYRLGDFKTVWPRKELLEGLTLVHPLVTSACLHALGQLSPLDTLDIRRHDEDTPRIICSVLDEDPAARTEPEIRVSAAEALGNFDRPQAKERLRKLAAEDPNFRVRQEAANSLEKLGEKRPDVKPSRDLPGAATPLAEEFVKSREGRYSAVVTTNRGEFEIELLNHEAPRTVQNFVQLAEKGFYDGIQFHRVVPNFVAQAGCPIGNGWGGPGYEIRNEDSPLHFERGFVGMATAGKDSGGSQFFVTHSRQPHLDGRYTIFGRVIRGMDVVDAIEIEDLIKKVKIKKKLL